MTKIIPQKKKYDEVLKQLNKLLMAYAGQNNQKTRKCGPLKIQSGEAKTAEGQQFLMLLAKVVKPILTIKKAGKRLKILYPNEKF